MLLINLSASQTPVMTADQPYHTLAKEIQKSKTDVLSENKLIMLMGDSNTKMKFMTCLGMPDSFSYNHHSMTVTENYIK